MRPLYLLLLLLIIVRCDAYYYNGVDDLFEVYNLPDYEYNALYDLYNSTNGQYWDYNGLYSLNGAVWNFSNPNANPCYEQWEGLTCNAYADQQMMHVTSIDLEYMNLSGTLPDTIGVFNYMYSFSIQYDFVSGHIPSTISNWSSPTALNLCGNQFSGPIPDTICNMSSLFLFALVENELTGTLPECISRFTNLVYFEVGQNHFHGHIPPSYGNIGGLTYFDASFNHLSGPLPPMPLTLDHLSLSGNLLTGPLPEQYSQLTLLQMLYVGENHLTGSFPESYGNSLQSLLFVQLVYNSFSDSLPSSLGNLTSLLTLDLSLNHFTGSLPSSMGPKQSSLAYLALGRNSFSGSLTPSLGALSLLQILFLYENLFTGPLMGVFNASIQTNLTTIDLSSNLFTGEVPVEPFQIPGLTTFAAVSNCLHGTLSPSLCNAENLQVLALDGLSTGSACQRRYFRAHTPPFSEIHSYGLDFSGQVVSGSLPLCLFNMSRLQTLHLSGNGISDTLTSEALVVSPSLRDLSLSHNQFYSTIPLRIQNRSWSNLDLSYNLFDGTLLEDISAVGDNASLSLEVNRLSGFIPSSLRHAQSIAMLDGNLFGCRADRSDLPSHDPDVKVFECGSNSFNYAVYVWLGLVFMVGCLWCALRLSAKFSSGGNSDSGANTINGFKSESSGEIVPLTHSQQLIKCLTDWMSVFHSSSNGTTTLEGVLMLGEICRRIRLLYLTVALFVCLVLLPAYVALSYYFDTYTYEYAWQVSGVYLSGSTPTVVVLVLLSVLFLLSVCLFTQLDSSVAATSESVDSVNTRSSIGKRTLAEESTAHSHPSSNMWQDQVKYLCFMGGAVLTNTAVVIGANVGYVYIEYHYSVLIVKLTQVALAAFKLLWYGTAVRPMLKLFRTKYAEDIDVTIESSNVAANAAGMSERIDMNSLRLEVFIVLFNNLLAPFVAVAFVSSDCFYNIFTDPPTVDASYEYSICQHKSVSGMDRNLTVCEIEQHSTMNTSYVPPFTYSYQCSSAYVTTYAPIFVFTFIIIAFVSPVAQAVAAYYVKVNHTTATSASAGDSEGRKESNVLRLMRSVLPPLLLPLSDVTSSSSSDNGRVKYFESDLFVVRVMNALGILFTFGSVVPALAVIGCVSLFSYTYFTQLTVGRLAHCLVTGSSSSKSHFSTSVVSKQLSEECGGVSGHLQSQQQQQQQQQQLLLFQSVALVLLPFAVLFYGLFLFDMLGSAVGALHAVWAPIAVAVVPALVCLCCWLGPRLGPLVGWRSREKERKSINQLNRRSDLNEKYGQSLLNNEIM